MSYLVEELPVKQKKKSNKERWFYYFIFDYRGHTTIQQRTRKDIWQQLYQFPLLESSTELNEELIFSSAEKKGLLKKGQYNITHVSPVFRQQLSHQLIKTRFLYVVLPKKNAVNDWVWLKKDQLREYTFPRIINRYLEETKW